MHHLPPMDDLDFVRDIADNDWMKPSNRDEEWYFRRGYGALELIADGSRRARLAPKTILDFGGGHGCVARMLKAFYAGAEVIISDTNPDWLEWDEEHLRVSTLLSPLDINDVSLEHSRHDLIWVGSVFTHIPVASADRLFSTLIESLTDDGLLIFSTPGQIMRNAYEKHDMPHITVDDMDEMSAEFDAGSYAFRKYKESIYPRWGHSLVPSKWYFETIAKYGCGLHGFAQGGWGGAQDVWSVTKRNLKLSWK